MPMKKLENRDHNQSERRKSPRVHVQIWVKEKSETGTTFHLVSNLSSGGLFIEKELPFPVGAVLQLELNLPHSRTPLSLKGKVVENYQDTDSDENGTGVKFIDIDDDARDALDNYLKSL